MYTLAKLPYTVYIILKIFVENHRTSPGSYLTEFLRIAIGTAGLNTISNFFIYSLTVKSFRIFLLARIRIARYHLTNTISRLQFQQVASTAEQSEETHRNSSSEEQGELN
jgi:hypothetical protein